MTAKKKTIARIRHLVLVCALAAGLVSSACGVGSDAPSGLDLGASTTPAMVPWCNDLVPAGPVSDAPPGTATNPDPIRTAVLQTYGAARPETYAGVWIDRESGGTTVVAFTDAPAAHRADLLDLAPSPSDVASIQPRPSSADGQTLRDSGFAFDVVQVSHTEADLDAVQSQVEAMLTDTDPQIHGVGQSPQLNRVELQMGVVDDDTRTALAQELPVDEVCVDGIDAASVTTLDPSTPTTLIPPAGSDATVECSGFTFPFSVLQQSAGFEQTDDPLAVAFRDGMAANPMLYLGGEPAGTGWILLARDDDRALLATGSDPIQTVSMEFTGRRWIWSGSGGCSPRVALPAGLGIVSWVPSPAPAPTDTEIHLLVSEQGCASGQALGDRLVGPEIRETADRIVIAFGAKAPGDGGQTCPSNPLTPVTVTLSAPVGDREIVDGTVPVPG